MPFVARSFTFYNTSLSTSRQPISHLAVDMSINRVDLPNNYTYFVVEHYNGRTDCTYAFNLLFTFFTGISNMLRISMCTH